MIKQENIATLDGTEMTIKEKIALLTRKYSALTSDEKVWYGHVSILMSVPRSKHTSIDKYFTDMLMIYNILNLDSKSTIQRPMLKRLLKWQDDDISLFYLTVNRLNPQFQAQVIMSFKSMPPYDYCCCWWCYSAIAFMTALILKACLNCVT